MKVTFPHMGHTWVGIHALFTELNMDYIVPPSMSRRTLSLAAQYSPSGLCLPFKLTLGNFIEALEKGADTLLQAGGSGICRLGRYAQAQEYILRELGYDFRMITMSVSEDKLRSIVRMFRDASNNSPWLKVFMALRFGIAKISVLDNLERRTQWVRPREVDKGEATSLFRQAIEAADKAGDYGSLRRVKREYEEKLQAVPLDPAATPLLVKVIGEFYVLLEPFSNLDVEIELGKLGVEVHRSTFVSEWTKFSFFLNPLGLNEKKRIHRAAMPYLSRDVGGDGWESVGEKVLHHRDYDGLVHLLPFTCMPEIIAQNIMPAIKEDIPVLSIICDEQMAKAGLQTRLEAFVDLLRRRRDKARREMCIVLGGHRGHSSL